MKTEKPVIGFIGLGVMGNSMASNILKAGYDLLVYNRTKSKSDSLVAKGAKWKDSPADIAVNSDLVISMVGYP